VTSGNTHFYTQAVEKDPIDGGDKGAHVLPPFCLLFYSSPMPLYYEHQPKGLATSDIYYMIITTNILLNGMA